jgi:putative transcriptional regulator
MGARRGLATAFLAACSAACLAQAPNGVLLVAKPQLADPNFRHTVVLVTQTDDSSTVGVILNRPSEVRHEPTGEPVFTGGPVMPRTMVALFRSGNVPAAPAFHVLQGIYLSMHPAILGALKPPYRLYTGFAGWRPDSCRAKSRATTGTCCPRARSSCFAPPAPECGKSSSSGRARTVRHSPEHRSSPPLAKKYENEAMAALSDQQVYWVS